MICLAFSVFSLSLKKKSIQLMYDNMFIHFNDTLRKMLWEPPCYGVLRTEINNRIESKIFFFLFLIGYLTV